MALPPSIRPRVDDEEDELSQVESSEAGSEDQESSDADDAESGEDDGSESSVTEEDQADEDLKDISFGALAEAQARFNPYPRKRKLADRDEASLDLSNDKRPAREGYDYKYKENQPKQSRSSKHAPTVLSTRNPVTRKKAVFSPPPAAKFRDPRFDAAIVADASRGNTLATQSASKNYAFLSDYQAAEVLDLKAQIKKTKDPDQQAQLKRQIMSIEAKLRNAQTQSREAQILQEHKRKEREAIREGRKARPYYLKQSDVKKQIQQERQEAMGKRARDKSEKRKKKREKTKEARDMPRVRRMA